jgi:peptidoglycan/LPS O-acetylase OafA/YrhL
MPSAKSWLPASNSFKFAKAWRRQNLMETIQNRLDSVPHPTGFDYLRLVLSISVIMWHSVIVCYGRTAEDPFWTGPLRPLVFFILPSFFALSGFLVASSLERHKIPQFLMLRCMRIFPALAVEVLISALILGPLLTTVTWHEYFSSNKFLSYLENTIGLIHYELPGVFENVPIPNFVNLQLWTVPVELYCYIAITVLALLSIARRPAWLFAVTLGGALLLTAHNYYGIPSGIHGIRKVILNDRPPNGMLPIAFLFGVSLYVMRRQLPFNALLLLISALVYPVLVMNTSSVYLAALPLAYVTVFLGLLNPSRTLLIMGADYSYGIYLYGFPLQQSISDLFPLHRVWYINVMGSLALAFVCAYLSWTLLESRVLDKRKVILSFVSSYSERLGSFLAKSLSPLRIW